MSGDERMQAQNKFSNSRPFFYVLNNEFDRAVKFSLTKRGYTHILNMNQPGAYKLLEPTNMLQLKLRDSRNPPSL